MQQAPSGIAGAVDQWLTKAGGRSGNGFVTTSLVALAGMALSGLGIALLPSAVCVPLIESGALRELKVTPKMLPINYVALTRADAATAFHQRIIELAQKDCDFEYSYQSKLLLRAKEASQDR